MTGGGGWDAETLRWAEAHYVAWPVRLLDLGLKASVAVILAATVVIVAVSLAARRPRAGVFWAMAIGGVFALDLVLKPLFARPALGGPPGAYSFPSGNAMLAAAVLSSVALSLRRRRRLIIAIGVPLVLLYGAALVYAWWHYPSDVAGGWCIAIAWVALVWWSCKPSLGARPFKLWRSPSAIGTRGSQPRSRRAAWHGKRIGASVRLRR
jgi:membrane-associated phospholipid phosphatase